MEYNQNIGKQLDSYSELFDIYLERGRVPQEYEEEPLSRYMRSQVEGFRDKIEKDEDLRELLRENIITLFGKILPGVLETQGSDSGRKSKDGSRTISQRICSMLKAMPMPSGTRRNPKSRYSRH